MVDVGIILSRAETSCSGPTGANMSDVKKAKLGVDDTSLFDQLFAQLVEELTTEGLANSQTVDAIQWMKKVKWQAYFAVIIPKNQ